MRPKAVLDIECFHGWFLVAVRDLTKAHAHSFEMPSGAMSEELREKIRKVLKTYRIYTFNGVGYDIPLLFYMLTGATVEQLKHASDRIVIGGLKPWNFEKEFHVELNHPDLDHVDLMPVAPLTGSLKLYAARLHTRSIRDLPIDPAKIPTEAEKSILREYCNGDLENTIALYQALKGQCELRDAMSEQYGIDLRSKSDPQVAEAVIRSELEKVTGKKIKKSESRTGDSFAYKIPSWMRFEHLDILETISPCRFVVSDTGKVVMPDELKKKDIAIGKGTYRMGIGGLHSCEKQAIHRSDETHMITDWDVTGYYSSSILIQGMSPPAAGPAFIPVYRTLVERRVQMKKAGHTLESNSLKVVTLAAFGKMGSKYSFLYAPDLFIQVTVSGQLAVLMLVEMFELNGLEVISANTDGVTVYCERQREGVVRDIVTSWEHVTGYAMELSEYDTLYARDVNSYVAIKTDGEVKVKGHYGFGRPLEKNPDANICKRAVIDYLQFDASLAGTIRACRDVRQFLSVRQVDGGAVWRGQPVGKVVRWYYSRTSPDAIHYKSNNYLVPKTQGAVPCTVLPEGIPADLDYEWYIREAIEMVAELGVTCQEQPEAQTALVW